MVAPTKKVVKEKEKLTREFYKNILTSSSPEKEKALQAKWLLERARKQGVQLPVEIVLWLLFSIDLTKAENQEIALDYLAQYPDYVKLLCDPHYPQPNQIKLTYPIQFQDVSPYYYQSVGEKVYRAYVDYLDDRSAGRDNNWLQQYQGGDHFLEPVKSLFDYLASVYEEHVVPVQGADAMDPSAPAPDPEVIKHPMNWFAAPSQEDSRRLFELLNERSRSGSLRSESHNLHAVNAEPVTKGQLTDPNALNEAKAKMGQAIASSAAAAGEDLQAEITQLIFNQIKTLKLGLGQSVDVDGGHVPAAGQHIDLFQRRLFARMGHAVSLSTVFDSGERLADSALANPGVACGILENPVLCKELFACLERASKPQTSHTSIDPDSPYLPRNFYRCLIARAINADRDHPIGGRQGARERFEKVLDLLLRHTPNTLSDGLRRFLLSSRDNDNGVTVFEYYLRRAFSDATPFAVTTARLFMKHFKFFVSFTEKVETPWVYLTKLFQASERPVTLLEKCTEEARKNNKFNVLLSKCSITILIDRFAKLGAQEMSQIEFDLFFDSIKSFVVTRVKSWKTSDTQAERDEVAGQITALFKYSELVDRLGFAEDVLLSLNNLSEASVIQQALASYAADDVNERINKLAKASIAPATPGRTSTAAVSLAELKKQVAFAAVTSSWKQVDPLQRYWIKAIFYHATSWLGKHQWYKTFFERKQGELREFSEEYFGAKLDGRPVTPTLVADPIPPVTVVGATSPAPRTPGYHTTAPAQHHWPASVSLTYAFSQTPIVYGSISQTGAAEVFVPGIYPLTSSTHSAGTTNTGTGNYSHSRSVFWGHGNQQTVDAAADKELQAQFTMALADAADTAKDPLACHFAVTPVPSSSDDEMDEHATNGSGGADSGEPASPSEIHVHVGQQQQQMIPTF